ncbi:MULTISPECIES: patatin-like phospholipase family protein [unclassified Chelatococcus]|uniref:patatin-like phospholipase family protein n=1 Tax=unclassified Chelatococcus TaxID=2638111 RepID=UPI001BD1B9F2|nr:MULTISPECIES: patatin-like phospholipase family protein [unclassified Chelatococcus]MBS7698118.1 patatin-like phospholipase family protein [Chelatococcus sp. YT9]MBX3556564.1 patatin-like phospholipase family protein [Chelatococcus sp.]
MLERSASEPKRSEAAGPTSGAAPASDAGTAPYGAPSRVKLGLALGGGAARGWSHIGVMKAFERNGLVPDVIVGTSIGAVVGGCFSAGKLDVLEEFARGLTRRRVIGLLDFHLNGSGLIAGDRLKRLLDENLVGVRAESLPHRFAAVATELGSGHEVWLTKGLLTDIMRASYALPGVLDAVKFGGRWLMDGALVNPIPVTVARALGADVVVCVNLNGDARSRGAVIPVVDPDIAQSTQSIIAEAAAKRRSLLGPVWGVAERVRQFATRSDGVPGIGTVMVDAFNITQDRIARSRLAGDPPDIMISPKLNRIGLFDFHKADESITLGAEAAERMMDEIREYLVQESAARQAIE